VIKPAQRCRCFRQHGDFEDWVISGLRRAARSSVGGQSKPGGATWLGDVAGVIISGRIRQI
jgi:hypothetical protein